MTSYVHVVHPELSVEQAREMIERAGLAFDVTGSDLQGTHAQLALPGSMTDVAEQLQALGDGWRMGQGLGALEAAQMSLLDQVRPFAAVGLTKVDGTWALALRQQADAPARWQPPTRHAGFPVDFAFVGPGRAQRA